MTENPPEGVLAGPLNEENFFVWEAFILGPPDTPYEGGLFRAILTFPSDYPLNPPKMRFTTPMWHPNSMFSHVSLLFFLNVPLFCV
jgi:ubiquitin-protein ligase